MRKKIIKFADKLVRGNWYILKHQKEKIENEKKRCNRSRSKSEEISESEIIRWAINNMPPYEKN